MLTLRGQAGGGSQRLHIQFHMGNFNYANVIFNLSSRIIGVDNQRLGSESMLMWVFLVEEMIRNGESDFVGSALESVAAMRRRDDCFIVDNRAAAQEVVEGDVDDPGPAVRNHVLAVEDPRREVTHRIFSADHILRDSIIFRRRRNDSKVGNRETSFFLLLVIVFAIPVSRVVVFKCRNVDDLLHSSADSPGRLRPLLGGF